jgi:hypothetical protein
MIYLKPQGKCNHNIIISTIMFMFLVHILLSCSVTEALPVFPGAKGFGVDTPAGRGGMVYKVTNLNDSGSGSLRAAIDASEPRVVIFEVSGTIILADDLKVKNPYITIAGQTAPSPGITLRGAGLSIRAHDVLVQHIRIRVGDGLIGPPPDNRDGIQIQGTNSYNVVVDHVSVSWSIDENISVYNANTHDVTISNCIASEALHDSIHPKGPHSMGVLIVHAQYVSIINNLLAHNNGRNPQLGDGDNTSMAAVNNVIYNWGNMGTRSNDAGTNKDTSVVGNVYISGGGDTNDAVVVECGPIQNFYVIDNEVDGYLPANPWDVVRISGICNPQAESPPVWPSGFTAMPSSETRAFVLSNAGARPADRDSVDTRIVSDAVNGTGSIIDSQDDVGGWPSLAGNYRTLIIPDNPNGDDNNNGYTNLEEWLHAYAAEVEGGTIPPPSDNEAPTVPAGLTATAISSSQINLSWSASTDNVGVTGYRIYRDGVQIATTSTTSYSDTGLSPLTTYTYTVSAIDLAGNESGQSSQVSATTQQPDTTPPTITSVIADASTQVTVVFSEPIEEISATNVSNYSIDNGITVSTATLDSDLMTVILTTSEHVDGTSYILTVNNIKDLASTPNVIAPNTTASYIFELKLVISNLTVESGQAYEIVENGLQEGAMVYIDRNDEYSIIPTWLEGATYIKTANEDRKSQAVPFLTFDVNRDVAVYIAHDDSITSKPSWLASFTDTGDDVVVSRFTFSIFERNYLAGTIILGGNEASRNSRMYTVIIVEQ